MRCTSYNDANEVVNELFVSLRSKYQDNLETWMRGSNFIFESVQSMRYKCHRESFKHGRSYIESPDRVKNKNLTITSKKNF